MEAPFGRRLEGYHRHVSDACEAVTVFLVLCCLNGVSYVRGGVLTLLSVAAGWFVMRSIAHLVSNRRRTFATTIIEIGFATLYVLLCHWTLTEPAQKIELPVIFVSGISILALHFFTLRCPAGGAIERVRIVAVAAAALFLLHPFLTSALRGAGDAQWYGNMLADMIKQVRAGVFPVYAGQSEYQFNGAIYPLRVAPAFHYFGAALDAFTLHTIEPVGLLNLLIISTGIAAAISCYLCLSALYPSQRWLNATLAVLFLSCPGVLGIAYQSDLYMTWMTLPFVPVAIFGVARSFQCWDRTAAFAMGAGLGIVCWGHTPTATWVAMVMLAIGIIRWACKRPDQKEIVNIGLTVLIFIAAAGYPLVSVLIATPEPGRSAADLQHGPLDTIVFYVKEVFPAVFKPLSPYGTQLSDLQLGYSFWFIFAIAGIASFRYRSFPLRALLVVALFLVLLLTPVPRLNLALWKLVPVAVRSIMSNWAMNRLYLPLATVLLFSAGQTAHLLTIKQRTGRTAVAFATVCLLLLWSGTEAQKFAAGSRISARPPESGHYIMQTENVGVTRFAYFNFSGTPAYFTHGVTNSYLESRLLSKDGASLMTGAMESIEDYSAPGLTVLSQGELKTKPKADSIFAYEPTFTLKPGENYALHLRFRNPEATGVLIVRGQSFFRVYALPEFGGAKSFGAAPGHSHLLPLWTTGTQPEEVTFEFRTQGQWFGKDVSDFSEYTFVRYEPDLLPVYVTSLIPYRASVTSPHDGWLETPRMYQTNYQAIVDGRRTAIAKSPNGLVMVPVPKGASMVKVEYYPPPILAVAFWFSLTSILASGAFLVVWFRQAAFRHVPLS